MRSDDEVTTLPREQRENIDRLLVCGELQVEGGRRWPSIRDLATKYGISISVIATQSTKYGCQARRKAFERYTTYNTPQFGELRGKDRTDWIKAQCAPPKVSPSATFRPTFPEAPAYPNEKNGIPRSPPPPPTVDPREYTPFKLVDDPNAEPYDRDEEEQQQKRRGPIHPAAVREATGYRRNEAPIIPWDEIDRLLVMGEIREKSDGSTETFYPTQMELSGRYGIHQTAISRHWRDHNCERRRKQAQYRLAIRVEEKIIDRRAEHVAVTKEETIQLADRYIVEFRNRLLEGKVRTDSVVDLNNVVRLKEFLLGGADSRQEIQGALTLSAIQSRHDTYLALERDNSAIKAIDTPGETVRAVSSGSTTVEAKRDTGSTTVTSATTLRESGSTNIPRVEAMQANGPGFLPGCQVVEISSESKTEDAALLAQDDALPCNLDKERELDDDGTNEFLAALADDP